MRNDDLQRIRNLPLFKEMADSRFSTLTKAGFLQRFPARVKMVAEGERADFLHIVVDGLIELFSEHRGRETTLGFCRPVTTFILAAVVTDKPYLNAARTIQPSTVLMIPAEAVRAVFMEDASFARAVVSELAQRYREMVKELKNQKLRPGIERLAAWILHHAENADGGWITHIPVEKGTLANCIGMTRENLSRHFATLENHGVEVAGRRILITDKPALEQLAGLNRLIDDYES